VKRTLAEPFRRFSGLGIRDKLLLLFVSLISLPVSTLAIRSYDVSSGIIEDKTNQYSHDILYQTTKMAESRLEKMEGISFNVVFDKYVQETLLAASNSEMDAYEENQVRTRIEAILSSQVLYNDEVISIYVVSSRGSVYELNKTKQSFGLMAERMDEIREAKGGVAWFGGSSGNRHVVLTRMIMSVRTQKPIGYFVMYVDEKYLFELLDSTQSIRNGSIVIVDGGGGIVSAADKELLGTKFGIDYRDGGKEAYSFTRKKVDEITQYVACSEPMRNGWRIITTVPVLIYQKEVFWLRNSIFLFALVLLGVSILCAWGLSLSISRPIRLLSSAMVRFGEGDFSVRSPRSGKDEIGRLSGTFNQMADNIDALVQKVLYEQQMKRDAELKSLQMQINPHFLYNTLESINWMARTGRNDDVCIMATSLGDLMRATINGKDHVLLKDEIASLSNYLQIQKYRYNDKLETSIAIAPGTEELYVPKLIIQPLVENAIYHGIEPSMEKGTIEIKSILDGGNLIITVTDNGVGMTPDLIQSVIDIDSKGEFSSSHSIGIKNVIKRIKALYGTEYGIEIQSELSDRTTVTIVLPAKLEIDNVSNN
jgi:two-component system sensor histidine kinase YesM